jgi:hypothetical protein
LKVAEGGYVPLALATAVYLVMWVWHRGAAAVDLPRDALDHRAQEAPGFWRDIVRYNFMERPNIPPCGLTLEAARGHLPLTAIFCGHFDRCRLVRAVPGCS